MRRSTPRITAFIAFLTLQSYLAAAALVCEPSGVEMVSIALKTSAAPSSGHHAAMAHAEHAEASVPRSHTPKHDQASHSSHHTSQQESDHAAMAHPEHAPAKDPTRVHDRRERKLEVSAVCLCGCSQTRSMVGGNTSRLGAVVPSLYLEHRFELERVPAPIVASRALVEAVGDLDPIPI